MIIERFVQSTSNLVADNRLLRVVAIAMAIAAAFSWYESHLARTYSRTHLIPTAAGGDLWISGDDASADYLWWMASSITNCLGDYSAASVETQFSLLMKLWHPETVEQAKAKLDEIRDTIKRFPSVTNEFTMAGESAVKRMGNRLLVEGISTRRVNGRREISKKVVYAIDFRIEHGRFWIEAIGKTER